MFLRCRASTQERYVDWRACGAVFVLLAIGITSAIGVASAAVELMICIDGVLKLETNIILAIILSKSRLGIKCLQVAFWIKSFASL